MNRLTEEEQVKEKIKEIILEIRQYLCSTEFAPEPFGKPVDIQKLAEEFPNQILQLFNGYLSPAEVEAARKEEQERIRDTIDCLDLPNPDPHSYEGEWEGVVAGKEIARTTILQALSNTTESNHLEGEKGGGIQQGVKGERMKKYQIIYAERRE